MCYLTNKFAFYWGKQISFFNNVPTDKGSFKINPDYSTILKYLTINRKFSRINIYFWNIRSSLNFMTSYNGKVKFFDYFIWKARSRCPSVNESLCINLFSVRNILNLQINITVVIRFHLSDSFNDIKLPNY